MKYRKLAAQYVVLILILCGCGTLDSTKGLNWQNRDAGDQLSKHSDPAVAEAGSDIRDNADAIANDIGQPKAKVPYSHDFSAGLRNQQAAELEARRAWADLGVKAVEYTLAALGISIPLVAWLRKGRALVKVVTENVKLKKYAEIVGSVIEKKPDIKAEVSAKAVAKGAAATVDEVVQEHVV